MLPTLLAGGVPECVTQAFAGARDWLWHAASRCQRLAGSSQRQMFLGRSPPTVTAAPQGQLCRLRPPRFSFLTAAQKHRACWEKISPLLRHPFTLKVLKGDCDSGPTYGQLPPLLMTRSLDKTHKAAVCRLWTKPAQDHCASDGICLRGGALMGRAPQLYWFSVWGQSLESEQRG